MSWVTVIWSVGGGACLTLAVIQFVVWWKDRTARANLVFSVLAIAVAIFGALELALMRAETPEQFGTVVRWLHIPAWLIIASLVVFVRLYLKAGRRWLAWTIVGVRTLSLILNFFFSPNINYRQITALRHIPFLGESVAVAVGVPNAWMLIAQLSLLLLLIFVIDAAIAVWRRGNRRQAIMVSGSIILFVVLATAQSVAITWDFILMPLTVSLFYQGLVAAMAYQLGQDVVRFQRDLAERLRLERLIAETGAALVNVTPERLDEEIETWMQRMIEILNADRIGLFEFTTDGALARNTHQATRKGVPSLAREFSYDQLSWYLGELRAGRSVVLSDLTKELPEQAAAEREVAREYGTRAVMGFPVAISGAVVHGIDCVLLHKARVWSEAAQNTLRLVGEIFANALAQRRAEIVLRESEERFRIVADSAPVLIWMSGTDKLCTFLNKPWLDFTGRTMEQEIGNGWAEGVHPDDLQRCLKTYTEAFDTRQPFLIQYRLRRHDGEYRWVSDNGVPRYDGQKNFAGYIGSCIDITESLSKEEALREFEERVSLAAQAAHLGVWELDTATNEIWMSDSARALFQLDSEAQVSPAVLQDRVHPEDRARRDSAVKAAIETQGEYEIEYRIVLPDGTLRWISGRGRCVPKQDAGTRLIGVSMDITPQKQTQDLFRLATEASPSGVILVDHRGLIVLVNSHAEKLFGYSREELIGKLVDILVPERFANQHPGHRSNFLAAPTARAMGAGRELFARRKDGSEFPVEIGLNPIRTPQGPLVLANVVDISARIAGEEEARRRREQVEVLSRVSLLGEMTASLAHELNQPLAAIMNNATAATKYIKQGKLDPKQLQEILTDVIGDGRRAYDIIGNVRSAIKKGSAIRGRINLNDVVKAVTHMVHPDAAANFCKVEMSLAPDLPAIEGDPIQIQQVLINLVRNAFDAMRDTPPSRRIVEIATNSNGDGTISVTVRDYGCGISEKTRERLFEQFFTTKEEGLGMGLAIVRSIVEAHGGSIAAENADGGGAHFHLRLPASEAMPQ
jgi:PAS domain S-box-containing protein